MWPRCMCKDGCVEQQEKNEMRMTRSEKMSHSDIKKEVKECFWVGLDDIRQIRKSFDDKDLASYY